MLLLDGLKGWLSTFIHFLKGQFIIFEVVFWIGLTNFLPHSCCNAQSAFLSVQTNVNSYLTDCLELSLEATRPLWRDYHVPPSGSRSNYMYRYQHLVENLTEQSMFKASVTYPIVTAEHVIGLTQIISKKHEITSLTTMIICMYSHRVRVPFNTNTSQHNLPLYLQMKTLKSILLWGC